MGGCVDDEEDDEDEEATALETVDRLAAAVRNTSHSSGSGHPLAPSRGTNSSAFLKYQCSILSRGRCKNKGLKTRDKNGRLHSYFLNTPVLYRTKRLLPLFRRQLEHWPAQKVRMCILDPQT